MDRHFLDPVHAADVAGVEREQRQRLNETKAQTDNRPDRARVKALALAGTDVVDAWAHSQYDHARAEVEAAVLRAEVEYPDLDPASVRDYVEGLAKDGLL